MKRIAVWILVGWGVVWLASCANLEFLNSSLTTGTPEMTAQVGQTPAGDRTPGASNGAIPAGEVSVDGVGNAGETTLVLWVPPQFDPQSETTAGQLLKQRLEEFSRQNPQIIVDVRVKATSGTASLVDSLAATSAAAPNALPDLIALSRQQLEVAALKGLVGSYTGLTTIMDNSDWYPYARELALLQNTQFGIPFSGDALVTAYRSSQISAPLSTWESILRHPGPLVFPAGDPESLVTIAFYLSEGGTLKTNDERPNLDAEALTRVLNRYQSAGKSGAFPYWITQFTQDSDSWQVYQEKRASLAFTWITNCLAASQADTTISFLPAGTNTSVTLADGWVWAMATSQPERRKTAVMLAEFLVEPSFLAVWSEAAGTLPPRSTALQAWTKINMIPFLDQVSNSAILLPNEDLLLSVGPVLKDATLQVIQNQADPETTAKTAADSLISIDNH